MPNNYYKIKTLRLKVLYFLAGWAVLIFTGLFSLNFLEKYLIYHSYLAEMIGLTSMDMVSLYMMTFACLLLLPIGLLVFSNWICLRFWETWGLSIFKHHHIFSLNLKSIPSINSGVLIPFWIHLGDTFGLSTDHLSAFVFHRVLSLDTPAENETELCSPSPGSTHISLLPEPAPAPRHGMGRLCNNTRICNNIN